MRYVTDEASRRQYTEFLTRHERFDLQQPVQRAAVKNSWKNEIVLAEDPQGNITGGLSVLIRKIPFFGSIMYSPRGPVCGVHDRESLRQLTEGAELLAWKYNAMALRMEPDILAEDEGFRAIARDLGWQIRDPRSGLYLFKSRFGAEPARSIGEVYMPYKPLVYRAWRLAERAFMTSRDRYATLRRSPRGSLSA